MNRVALGDEGKRVMDEIAGKVRDTFNRLHCIDRLFRFRRMYFYVRNIINIKK